jgi:2,4-dienoyl-CoA reductase-like NADH-dependent reductase (Old Yellow Enzyme family)
MENTKSIFDKSSVEHHTLKNRLVVAPLTRKSAYADGTPSQPMISYYSAFAKGGFSLIITEGIYTDDLYSKADANQPGLVTQKHVDGWKEVVNGIHQYKALVVAQLMHGGALGQYSEHNIAPSAIRPIGLRSTEIGGLTGDFPVPKEMNAADLNAVKNGYVNAALMAYQAGFDGVELHGANGYLFDQFVTEHTNLRTDQYGGSTVNRLRFLMEVFDAIKEALPTGFIIGIRLSESKVNNLVYRWPGGSATAIEIFSVLKNISPSYYHLAAEGGNWVRECLYTDGQSSSSIAKSLTGVPVIANGGLHDLSISLPLLQNNHADLLSIGRAAIANPDWPNLIANGRQPVPFFNELIKPSLTLAHTHAVLSRYHQQTAMAANLTKRTD